MNKLIAKLLYPIYAELCKIHNETVINSPEYKALMEGSLNAQKEFDDFHGKPWGYQDSGSVSVDTQKQEHPLY